MTWNTYPFFPMRQQNEFIAKRDGLVMALMSPSTYALTEVPTEPLRSAFNHLRLRIGQRMVRTGDRKYDTCHVDPLAEDDVVIDLYGRLIFGVSYAMTVETSKRHRLRQFVGSLLASYYGGSMLLVDHNLGYDALVRAVCEEFNLTLVRGRYEEIVLAFVALSGIAATRLHVSMDVTEKDIDQKAIGRTKGLNLVTLTSSLMGFVPNHGTGPLAVAVHGNLVELDMHFADGMPTRSWVSNIRLGVESLAMMLMTLVTPTEIARGSTVEAIFMVDRDDLLLHYAHDVFLWSAMAGKYRPFPSMAREYNERWPWLPRFWDMTSLPSDATTVYDIMATYALCVSFDLILPAVKN